MKTKRLLSFFFSCSILLTGVLTSCSEDNEPSGGKKYVLTVKVKYPEDIKQDELTSLDIEALNASKEISYKEGDAHTKEVSSFEVVAGQYVITSTGKLTPAISVAGSVTADVYQDTEVTVELSSVMKSPLIFKEIYFASTLPFYINDTYYEIVNNSDEVQYLDQVILGSMTLLSAPNPWKNEAGQLMDKYPCNGYVVAFPGTGKEHPIQPGESVVIANDATNHKAAGYENRPDMTRANWEVYRANATMFTDTDYDAPNMDIVYCNATTMKGFALGMFGQGLIMAKLPEGVTPADFAAQAENLMTEPNSTKTTKYLMIPSKYMLDAVEIFDQTSSAQYHTLLTKDDAGFTTTPAWSAKSVRRKAIEIKNGRVYYQDTNDSSKDFLKEQPLTPGSHPTSVDQ